VMICIGTGHLVIDENRMRYTPELYFKTAAEMRVLFADIPGACDATLEIAARCNVELKLDATSSDKYPQFGTPDGSPREQYLMRVCQEGLVKRYGAEKAADPEIAARLNYEVDVINHMGFASYFLITADFIQWARDQDIPVGPGRGSAAGSLVAYAMAITDICPLRFGLLFERFLNPERVSPPDVDIDFCQSRRGEVIDYVRRKYGERCVSHIITYGTMGAKSVIRDVGRVMGLPYSDGDRLSKLIDPKPNDEEEKKKHGSSILRREWDKHRTARTCRSLVHLSGTLAIRARAGRPEPQRRHPRRGNRHRRPPARRTRPAHPRQRRRSGHPIRHEGHHRCGPAQNGLPRVEKPHRHP
jgi:DNA polymerase-3 subunit alpha